MERTPETRAELPVLPVHVAIIMDGNGRWAQQRGLPRVMGHQKGTETVRVVKDTCLDLKIPYLTLYAFSRENWKRPKAEIEFLMNLLDRYLDSEMEGLAKEGVRFRTIGDLTSLHPRIQDKINALKARTERNTLLHLTLALNYGARQEILQAVKRFSKNALEAGSSAVDKINALDVKIFEQFLDTAGIPDPDLLIRTSGEMRLSNFLLWQCSYSEIYVSDKMWPDFGREDFVRALREFAERERRYGAVS
jgi:undecaprenyl diphosphate synthase